MSHTAQGRQYVYRARVSEGEVRRSMVSGLTDLLFGGDVAALMVTCSMQAASGRATWTRCAHSLPTPRVAAESEAADERRDGGTLLSLLATLGVAWLLTYAVHSTVLIGDLWLAERTGLLRSLRLRDLAWRTALVGGLVTATLQLRGRPHSHRRRDRAPGAGARRPDPRRATRDRRGATHRNRRSHGPRPSAAGGARPSRGTPSAEAAGPCPRVPAIPAVPPFLLFPPCPRFRPSRRRRPPPRARRGERGPCSPLAHTLAVPRLSPAGLAFLGWAVVASAFLLRLAVLRARLLTALGERAPVMDPLVRARLEGLCRDVGHVRPVRLTTAEGLKSPSPSGGRRSASPPRRCSSSMPASSGASSPTSWRTSAGSIRCGS